MGSSLDLNQRDDSWNIGLDHIQTFAFKSNFDDDADDDDGYDELSLMIIDDVDNVIDGDNKPGPFQVLVQAWIFDCSQDWETYHHIFT